MNGCLADKLKMSPTSKPSTARKIWSLLLSAERLSAVVLLGLIFIGMVLANKRANKRAKAKIFQASTR